MRSLRLFAAATVAALFALLSTTSSFAAATVNHPAPITAGKTAQVDGTIVVAQRRGRGRRGRRGRRRGRGAAIAGGIIAGAIGAAIIADQARANRRYYDDDYRPRRVRRRGRSAEDRCADQFRSFRYSDGTYQPYDTHGRRLCPYLR